MSFLFVLFVAFCAINVSSLPAEYLDLDPLSDSGSAQYQATNTDFLSFIVLGQPSPNIDQSPGPDAYNDLSLFDGTPSTSSGQQLVSNPSLGEPVFSNLDQPLDSSSVQISSPSL